MKRSLVAFALAAAAAIVVVPHGPLPAQPAPSVTPQWIWYPEGEPRLSAPAGARYFRLIVELSRKRDDGVVLAVDPAKAEFEIVADNHFELFVNGRKAASGDDWRVATKVDLTEVLKGGRNVLAVKAVNDGAGPAGLAIAGSITLVGGNGIRVQSDATWKVSREAPEGWTALDFDDSKWVAAKPLGEFGKVGPWAAAAGGARASVSRRFEAKENFVVERVAEPSLTGSIVRFAFDHKGRPMISRERGPLLILDDVDKDGKYTKATVYSDQVVNCQGLFDHLGTVYSVGQSATKGGPAGLFKQTGEPGAVKAQLIRASEGGIAEHGPHQVLLGPDGRLYWCLGNHAYAPPYAANSPRQNWYEGQLLHSWNDSRGHAANKRTIGGTILRAADAAGSAWTMEAGGFRNQYAIAFDRSGELWSWDSDMEWDVDQPWYRPVRVNHCPRGADFGWRTGTANAPEYQPDSLGTAVDIGRGSPCGMVFHHHTVYPPKYDGALFVTDWSMGRIIAVFPERSGSGFTGTWEEFVTGRPLNVTDVDFGPDGHLYFSTGGRNTEGGLYRVRWTGGNVRSPFAPVITAVDKAVHQAQPESSWALARIAEYKKEAGASWDKDLPALALDTSKWPTIRVRALTLMQQFGPAPDEALALRLAVDKDAEVRAAAMWLLGELRSQKAWLALGTALNDADPVVVRRAIEGLLRHGVKPPEPSNTAVGSPEALVALCGHSDRNIRFLAHQALKRLDAGAVRGAVFASKHPHAQIYGMMALAAGFRDPADVTGLLDRQFGLLTESKVDNQELLDLCRAIALTLIVHEGGIDAMNNEKRPRAGEPLPAIAGWLGNALLARFPHADWRVNREIARLCCHLQTPGTAGKLLEALRKGVGRETQIHYAYCLRALRGQWDEKSRAIMFDWFVEASKWSGGASFTGHIDITFAEWLKNLDPALADELRAKRSALKPKEPERIPVKPEKSKYSFDELADHLTANRGNAARGLDVLRKAQCLACHRFGTEGEGAGPDLSTVSKRFQRREIVESLLYPSKVISDQYRGSVWKLNDERVITGIPATQTDDTITVIQLDSKKIVIRKADIEATKPAEFSIMPEGLLNPFTLEQIADLFALLDAPPATGK